MRKVTLILVYFLVPFLSQNIWAQEIAPPEAKPWPTEIWETIERQFSKNEIQKLGIKIENAIFDQIENIKLRHRINRPVSLDGRISRRIYSNWDPRSPPKDGFSWSVVDQFGLTTNFSALDFPIPIIGSPITASFSVGSSFSLDLFNIRQIYDWNLKTQKELEDNSLIETSAKKIDENMSMSYFPEERAKLERMARRKRIFNLLAFPFRFPLNHKHFKRMKVGEIFAYTGKGTISAGVNVGVVPYHFPLLQINNNASISTYVSGNFRISLFKFADDRIRLKMTRGRERGWNGGIANSNRATYLNGFFVLKAGKFKGIKVPDQTFEIIPFSFHQSKANSEFTEFVYEYHLDSPVAMLAIDLALKGDLSVSQFLSTQNDDVKAIYKKTQKQITRNRAQRFKLGPLFEATNKSGKTTTEYKMEFPDGKESEIFEVERNSAVEMKNDLAFREVQTFSAVASLDQSCIRNGNEKCFQLQTNYTLLDSNTKYREMMEIVNFSEQVLRQDIFPNFSEEFEEIRGEKHYKKKYFWGKTEMQIGQIVGQEQLKSLFEIDDDTMWKNLSILFAPSGTPDSWDRAQKRFWYMLRKLPHQFWDLIMTPFIPWKNGGKELSHAKRFFNLWKQLKNKYELNSVTFFQERETVTLMTKLFNSPRFAKEMMTILKDMLPDNGPYTFFDFTSTSLGAARIMQKNPSILNEDITNNLELTNYDIFPKTLNYRPTINIHRFVFDENSKIFSIDFGLAVGQIPKYLQFELHRSAGRAFGSTVPRFRQVGGAVFYENNQGKFENLTKISLAEIKNIQGVGDLLSMIKGDHDFYLAMSYSLNKSEWSAKKQVVISRRRPSTRALPTPNGEYENNEEGEEGVGN
ncbi:MAG: hypothetical protein QE271_14485 [Bacteriovoracaceae bacterium]|nr:hypothetical protein [Bacteriovoracaceae bacterium]